MIPKIIHQTWKTDQVPEALRYFQHTWRRHHPDWEYRLWTDSDNRAFIARHYAWFLPVFDGYLSSICRADAIRYFLMRHFGGVYADLDFECLEPLDGFLAGHEAMLGLEPTRHEQGHRASLGDVSRLVCNALMASRPGHAFWDHVIERMVQERSQPGPLDATGPFLLSRALDSYAGPDPVTVVASEHFYPVTSDDCVGGRLFDLDFWHRATAQARAIHHWAGTWYRKEAEAAARSLPTAVPVQVVDRGRPVITGAVHAQRRTLGAAEYPLVSCLMVTRNRPGLALQAVRCFQRQTWPNRELVVLDEGPGDELGAAIAELADPRIRHVRREPDGSSLGALRNAAVSLARGAYVCQWDDDDLYDAARIELQMGALQEAHADACMLSRWTLWWPEQRRFALSLRRPWEGSLLCARDRLPSYPDRRHGEDTPVAAALLRGRRVALLDLPRLYVYVVHGANTFGSAHFESHWEKASLQITGAGYGRAWQELEKGLDLASYLAALNAGSAGRSGAAAATPTADSSATALTMASAADRPARVAGPGRRTTACPTVAVARVRRRAATEPGELPSVLVLTPVKDAERHLPDYLRQLEALDYPRERLSLAFLEGNSSDRSHEWLQDHREAFRRRVRQHRILQRDHDYTLSGPRSAAEDQYGRRRAIALCRNELFRTAHSGEDYVLWIDADVIGYPPDVLRTLLAQDREVVVPHCVLDPGGATFDLNTFVHLPGQDRRDWRHARDAIVQPPRGHGRKYLDAFRGQGLVAVDSVGGTMLLVASTLHAQGVLFPPYSYRGYIETEGFAMLARDRGRRCWGLPDLEIVHARD